MEVRLKGYAFLFVLSASDRPAEAESAVAGRRKPKRRSCETLRSSNRTATLETKHCSRGSQSERGYSCLRATIGSIPEALRAGTYTASAAVANNKPSTAK